MWHIGDFMDNQQKFEFMKEKVKERPINKKKLVRRTLMTVSMAIIFGLIACLTFSLLEPLISNWLNPQEEIEKIEIPLVSEEILPEDMMVHEEITLEPSQEVIEILKDEIELGTKDYQKLYQSIHELTLQIQKAEVTVTRVIQDIDIFNDAYESRNKSVGYIFAQNSTEIMILVEKESVSEIENIEVTFVDGSIVPAHVRGTDANTGLAVLVADKTKLTEATLEAIGFLNLGNSDIPALLASPVIAIGNPLGNRSVVYGMITSTDTVITMSDGNYRLLTTDIYGSEKATGILVNLDGKVVGIIRQEHNQKEISNLILALGISEIKYALQRMSNGIGNSYIGIQGTEVPAEVARIKDVPAGVYVTGIAMGSPAMQAGIQSGDIIVNVDKSKIVSFSDYVKILNSWNPGEEKIIYLMRQGQSGYKLAKVEVVAQELK